MGRVGKKQKKNPCKQKGFEKKYMHQTCLKCEKAYFLKKHTYTADNLEKNANIKNLPHPSHHFSNGPSLMNNSPSLLSAKKQHLTELFIQSKTSLVSIKTLQFKAPPK
jgi:hypothetical protein